MRRRRRISNNNNTVRLNSHRRALILCLRPRSKRMVHLLLLGVGRVVALIHRPLTLERLARADTGLVQNANALTPIKSASPGGAE